MKKPKILIAVSEREHAAILVALRMAPNHYAEFRDIWKNYHGVGLGPAPTNDDLDILCEKVNCDGKTISEILKERFVWLGTADGSDVPYPSGADAIDAFEQFYRDCLAGGAK